MPTGKVLQLVHLSQQTYQPSSQLIASHNDKGYGTIQGEDGQPMYFSHAAVPDRHGFDNLRRGQVVEYVMDPKSRYSASSVVAKATEANQMVTTDIAESHKPSFAHVLRTFRRPRRTVAIPEHPLDGYP